LRGFLDAKESIKSIKAIPLYPPLIKGFPSLPVLARPGKKRGQGRFIGELKGDFLDLSRIIL